MRGRSEVTQGQAQQGTSGAGRQILAGVFIAASFTAVGLLHVSSRLSVLDMGYRLGRAEDQHRTLERDNVALKLQLATLRSAAHLENTARTQLGMVTPSAQSVFQVGGPVTPVVKAPAPATAKQGAKKPAPKAPLALLDVGHR